MLGIESRCPACRSVIDHSVSTLTPDGWVSSVNRFCSLKRLCSTLSPVLSSSIFPIYSGCPPGLEKERRAQGLRQLGLEKLV